MGPVENPGCGEERHRLRARGVRVAVARDGHQRFLHRHARHPAAVDGHDVVLARLHVPGRDHGDELVPVLGRHVAVLGEVLVDVVELPALGVEFRELLGRDRLPEAHARLGERGARPRADRPPAVVVDGAVAEHLEVLGVVLGGGRGVVERVGEAHALERRLRNAPDGLRRLEVQQIEDGRHHVDDVGVLATHFALGLDAYRPGDDEGVAGAAAVGLALPATEGRVARERQPQG